ncbi:O-antigen ligase family protein [Candidatus Saccharibacteria bacterium]|nr:O-antigen ligase family protein [Candidatus Saccharibacteria bacterium]
MLKKDAKERITLPIHVAVPVLLLTMLVVPWFSGGQDSFGLLVASLLTTLLYASWLILSRHHALSLESRPRSIMYPLAGLLAWTGLSLIWSVSRYTGITQAIRLAVAAVIFIIARDVFRHKLAQVFFAKIFITIALIVTLIGNWFYLFGDYDRLTSLFNWPNPLATFLIVALFFSFWAWDSTKGRERIFWRISAGILASGIYLTYSRAAWLVLGVGLALHWWFSQDRRSTVIEYVRIATIAFLLSLILIGARERLVKKPTIDVAKRVTDAAQSTSVNDRIKFWQEGSIMFADRPIAGWGIGAYADIHPAYQQSPTTASNNPHNSLIQVFIEQGFIGAALYILAIVGIVRYIWLGRANAIEPLRWAGLLGVVIIGSHSMLDFTTNYPSLIILLAICLALGVKNPRDMSHFRLKQLVPGAVTVLGGILVFTMLWASYIQYTNGVRQQYIDAIGSLDKDEALTVYKELASSRLVPVDALSMAAILQVDKYDSLKVKNPDDLNSALRYAERATSQEPNDARHWYALANVKERLGKRNEALAYYRRTIELDPYDNPQYYINYALLMDKEGSTNEAIVALKKITSQYTDAVLENRSAYSSIKVRVSAAHSLLAQLYINKSEIEKAKAEIARALILNADNITAQNLDTYLKSQASPKPSS